MISVGIDHWYRLKEYETGRKHLRRTKAFRSTVPPLYRFILKKEKEGKSKRAASTPT